MIRKLPEDTADLFQETGRMRGNIGGKPSLETPEERNGRAKAAVRRNGARQGSPAVAGKLEASRSPTSEGQALILADQILNRLLGYARKGSRTRNDFYRRDLRWIRGVLMRIEAGEPEPLRPTGE